MARYASHKSNNINFTPTPAFYSDRSSSDLHMNFEQNNRNLNTADPRVWGPSFWFTLHNGAKNYPLNADAEDKYHMKNFILALPTIIPCSACSSHAKSHIRSNYHLLDHICSGRDNLFNFFWLFLSLDIKFMTSATKSLPLYSPFILLKFS